MPIDSKPFCKADFWFSKRREMRQLAQRILSGKSQNNEKGDSFISGCSALPLQVKLSEASMRPGQSQQWLDAVEANVVASVALCQAVIHCHCGTW